MYEVFFRRDHTGVRAAICHDAPPADFHHTQCTPSDSQRVDGVVVLEFHLRVYVLHVWEMLEVRLIGDLRGKDANVWVLQRLDRGDGDR